MDVLINDYTPKFSPRIEKRSWRRPPTRERRIKARSYKFIYDDNYSIDTLSTHGSRPGSRLAASRSTPLLIPKPRYGRRPSIHSGRNVVNHVIKSTHYNYKPMDLIPLNTPVNVPLLRTGEAHLYHGVDDHITHRTKKRISHPRFFLTHHHNTHGVLKRNKFIPRQPEVAHDLTDPLRHMCHTLMDHTRHTSVGLPPRLSLYRTLVPPLRSLQWQEPRAPVDSVAAVVVKKVKLKKVLDDTLFKFRSVGALTKENETKMFDQLWDEIELTDVLTSFEIDKIQAMMQSRNWFGTLRLFFVVISGMRSPYETMNMTDWLGFCKQCKLYDKKKQFTPQVAQLIFTRVNVEESSEGVTFDSEGKKISKGIAIKEDDLDNPDNAFILSEFAEAVIRAALEKYKKSPDMNQEDMMSSIFEHHLLRYGPGSTDCGIDVQAFRKTIKDEEIQEIYKKHAMKLRKQFDHFCLPHKNKDEDSMDIVRMEAFFKQCPDVILQPLTLRQVSNVFILSRDENLLQESYELRYASFLEHVARCAVIRFGGPQPGMPGVVEKLNQPSIAECCDQFFDLLTHKPPPKTKFVLKTR